MEVIGRFTNSQPARELTNFLWTGKVITMLSRFARAVSQFVKREDGPTAVEYAVMLALIIVVCISAITALGSNANATFTNVEGSMANVGS